MSIFDENPTNVETLDEGKDYVAELVGDGKKFKDTQALARGKAEADLYIKQLTERLDEARKELETRMQRESFLEEIKGLRNSESNGQNHTTTPVVTDPVPLDDSILEQKLLALLQKQKTQERQESNIDRVERVLKERLGDQANQVINNKARELGLSPKELEGIAINSPAAFFQLVGVQEDRQPASNVPVARNTNNSFGQPQTQGVKNKAFYEKLKQTDPKAYWNPKIVAEMIKARQECESRGIAW